MRSSDHIKDTFTGAMRKSPNRKKMPAMRNSGPVIAHGDPQRQMRTDQEEVLAEAWNSRKTIIRRGSSNRETVAWCQMEFGAAPSNSPPDGSGRRIVCAAILRHSARHRDHCTLWGPPGRRY